MILRMTATEPANVASRILIVRLSAIGDVLHALPVLCALRDALPQAHLAWMVEGRGADLLQGHPALDELIAVRRRWLKSPRAVLDVWRRVHGRFDITIDVQGLSKSAVAARLTGARQRIGMAAPDGREISPWLNNVLVRPTAAHVIDRNLELLGPLGIASDAASASTCPSRPPMAAGPSKRSPRRGATSHLRLINPGAGWPSKLWPAERFAAVAEHLGRVHGLRSLAVWAGDQEHAWAQQIVAGSGGWARLAAPHQSGRAGGAGPAGTALRQCRHWSVAPGGGRGHSLRWAVRPDAGREERALRPRAYHDSNGPARGIESRASPCQ